MACNMRRDREKALLLRSLVDAFGSILFELHWWIVVVVDNSDLPWLPWPVHPLPSC